jgi:cytochrome c biogenesis protein CcmG, thiol:disulfide interchange protein DsbE
MVMARVPGGSRLKTLVIAAASALLVVTAVTVLTAGTSGPAPLQQATPFTLTAVGDPARPISLADYAGRPVIINFFASWCDVCRIETPLIAGFYRAHHGAVLIVGIDGNDHTKAALTFMHAHGVTYPVAADPSLSLTSTYGAGAGFPQTFFLNAKHQIVRHVFGAVTAGELSSWASEVLAHSAGAS